MTTLQKHVQNKCLSKISKNFCSNCEKIERVEVFQKNLSSGEEESCLDNTAEIFFIKTPLVHSASENDLKKHKHYKTVFSAKSFGGHIKISFDNPAEKLLPIEQKYAKMSEKHFAKSEIDEKNSKISEKSFFIKSSPGHVKCSAVPTTVPKNFWDKIKFFRSKSQYYQSK